MNQKTHSNLSLTIKVGAFLAGLALAGHYIAKLINVIF